MIQHFFDMFYLPLVGIKDFNALIDNETFFYQLVRNKQEAYEKLVKISRNNWLYNRKLVRLFVPSKILETYWYGFNKASRYNYYSTI